MFVTEEEGNRRLRDPRNVLTHIEQDDTTRRPVDVESIFIPVIPEPASSPETPDPAESQSAYSDCRESIPLDPLVALKLEKLLNPSSTPGRKPIIRNRTIEENAAVGLTSLLLGGAKTEEMFGVPATVQSNLTKGYTSSTDKAQGKNKKDELLEEIYNQSGQVANLAFSRLKKALNLLDDQKLEDTKDPMKLVTMAKSLSGIIKDVTPKDGGGDSAGVHFHIYRPEQAVESDYEVVEVNGDGTIAVTHS